MSKSALIYISVGKTNHFIKACQNDINKIVCNEVNTVNMLLCMCVIARKSILGKATKQGLLIPAKL